MNFDYIRATEDEIFKKLPKQTKKVPTNGPVGYANLEDIMKV